MTKIFCCNQGKLSVFSCWGWQVEEQRETQPEHEPSLQVSHGHKTTKYFCPVWVVDTNSVCCRKGTKSKHGAGHVWVLASETEGEGEGSYDRVGQLCSAGYHKKYSDFRMDFILSNLSAMRRRQLKRSGKFWIKAANLSKWRDSLQLSSTAATVNLHLTNPILNCSPITRQQMIFRGQPRRYWQESRGQQQGRVPWSSL